VAAAITHEIFGRFSVENQKGKQEPIRTGEAMMRFDGQAEAGAQEEALTIQPPAHQAVCNVHRIDEIQQIHAGKGIIGGSQLKSEGADVQTVSSNLVSRAASATQAIR
jgi:hypothetical protein